MIAMLLYVLCWRSAALQRLRAFATVGQIHTDFHKTVS